MRRNVILCLRGFGDFTVWFYLNSSGKPKHFESPMSALKASLPLTNVIRIADSARAFSPGSPQNFGLPGICMPGRLSSLASFSQGRELPSDGEVGQARNLPKKSCLLAF